MIWSIIQVIGRQGITFLIFTTLAIILSPADFGVLGMAMVWIAFIQTFSEMGFGAALIQRQNVDSKHFSTIFFINVAAGIVLTFIGIIISWPSAFFFKTPEVQPIMAFLSFGFVINSFSLTQMTIAQKEMRFRDLAMRDISASLIGGITGIILALLKYGIWSLVILSLTTSIVGTLLLWKVSKWRPKLREFSFKYAKDLWPYSSKIFLFNIFRYFAQNTDKLLVGYLLGSVALGLYTFAYNITILPISTFVGAIGNYLLPKFSRMQADLELVKSSYLFINKAINSVVAPLMVIVIFLSPILIPYIWGQKWIQAIPLIQIFAILAILQSLISPVGQLMKALNRPGWLFNWSVLITVVVLIFVWIGARYKGIVGATFGLTIAHILAVPIIFFIIRKLVHISTRDILNSLLPSTISSLLIGLLLLWLWNSKIFLGDTRVLISLFSGALLYLICLILFDKPFVVNIYRRVVQ